MSKLLKNDILNFGLQVYKIIGEDIQSTPKKLYIFRIFNLIILVTVLFFTIANCFRAKGFILIKTLESAITIFHTLIKYSLFIKEKSEINILIRDRLQFWNPRDVDKGIYKQANNILKYVRFMQRVLIIVFITSIHFHFLKPLINTNNVFPLNAWTIYNSLYLDIIILAMEYYTLTLVTAIVWSYDAVFISICVHISIELRLVKHKIGKPTKNFQETLYACIERHQLLLSMFVRMQEIYSWILLIQYLMTLGMTCVQLFILNTGKYEVMDAIELVLYLATMYVEFGYFSVPVELIRSEFIDIANGIYMSSWYKYDVSTQKNLLVIMSNAQRTRNLNGGGLVQINIDTFASIFRKSFSLYLMLKNLIIS